MNIVDNKIKNIYYMLCFSFNKNLLSLKDSSTVGSESFDNIYNLFSIILCMMVRKQVKKGVTKDYININDELTTVRGKINLTNTIQNTSMTRGKMHCDFDDFSENNPLNQIIKTTAYYLIKSNYIGKSTKKELQKTIVYFFNVDVVNISSIDWRKIIYNRNNNSYKQIIVLCELILKGLIVSDKNGKEKFNEFIDESALHRIYENFIREYYKKKGLPAAKRKFKLTENDNSIVGMAETDITLENETDMLIIDAKFYTNILKDGRYEGSRIISRDNVYQVFTYVVKQEFETNKNVKGMLLYAQTINEPEEFEPAIIARYEIKIRTLDLNKDWNHICTTLDGIALDFLNGNI